VKALGSRLQWQVARATSMIAISSSSPADVSCTPEAMCCMSRSVVHFPHHVFFSNRLESPLSCSVIITTRVYRFPTHNRRIPKPDKSGLEIRGQQHVVPRRPGNLLRLIHRLPRTYHQPIPLRIQQPMLRRPHRPDEQRTVENVSLSRALNPGCIGAPNLRPYRRDAQSRM
jgi:hypothetical protein